LQIQGLGQLIQYLMRQPCAGEGLLDYTGRPVYNKGMTVE
jgi:hypothetical protein